MTQSNPSMMPVPALVSPARLVPLTVRQSAFDKLADSALMRQWELVQDPKRPQCVPLLPVSAPTLWRMVADGRFPQPVRMARRITVWRVSDVRQWLNSVGGA